MSSPHEHLENAEHAEHHASDPLNQRVAVSMAIVAACLAGISMLGHRTHNEVLQLQGESNTLRIEAAKAEVERSNLFAWYQSKKNRQVQYDLSARTLELATVSDTATQQKQTKDWKKKAEEYNKTNDKKDNLPDLEERGEEAGKHAVHLTEKARTILDEAKYVHLQADRLDIGHLLAEVALVLCSITLLTKKKIFWYVGLGIAVVAIGLTVSAYFIPHEPHPAPKTLA